MAFFQSFLHVTNFRNPLLRSVVPTVAAIAAIQTAVAVPSIALQTERFYDASGAATFLLASFFSLRLPALRAASLAAGQPNWRQTTITSAVLVWAATREFESLKEAPTIPDVLTASISWVVSLRENPRHREGCQV